MRTENQTKIKSLRTLEFMLRNLDEKCCSRVPSLHCYLIFLIYLIESSVQELGGMLLGSRGWLQGLQDDQIGGRSVQLPSLNKMNNIKMFDTKYCYIVDFRSAFGFRIRLLTTRKVKQKLMFYITQNLFLSHFHTKNLCSFNSVIMFP